MQDPGGNIRVVIRIRPLADGEQASGLQTPWSVTEQTMSSVVVSEGRQFPGQTFHFDRVYDAAVTETRTIFEQIAKDLIDGALDGVNATVFAYGQTSAGKTFTMQGPPSNPGIIPLGLAYFFERLEHLKRQRAVTVKLSYLEIYNEVVGDLLAKDSKNLKIHETVERGVFVGGISEPSVGSLDEALELVRRGEEVRKIGRTNLNEYSSRSHTLLRVELESRPLVASCSPDQQPAGTRASVLAFVDLAGSERSGQMGNEGVRLKEGGHINKSLLSLTTVISKLAEAGPSSNILPNHIPYRDSKLTRILQPALGGNARCAIICAVTPSLQFVDETLSTLKFASRAKAIRTRAVVNEVITEGDIIRCYREQVECLKGELGDVRKRAADYECGLAEAKRAKLNIKSSLDLRLASHLQQLAAFRGSIQDMAFIVDHMEGDCKSQMTAVQRTIAAWMDESQANLDFAIKERQASELAHSDAVCVVEEQLRAVVQENEALKAQHKVAAEQLLEKVHRRCLLLFQIAALEGSSCDACAQLGTEIAELSECVARMEERLRDIPSEDPKSKRDHEMLQTALDAVSKRLCEKEQEVEDRQSDLNELLDKLMQTKSDYTTMRETLTTRINELDDEIEHWRLLGKESEDRMAGLVSSLQAAQDKIKTLESSQSEAERQVAGLERSLSLQTEQLSAAVAGRQCDHRELASLKEQLTTTTSLLQEVTVQRQQEHQDSLDRIAQLSQEVERASTANAQHEKRLQEVTLREQIVADSHRREVQVILERLEMSEKQKTDLSINYSALASSAAAKEQQQLESIKVLQETLQLSQGELSSVKAQYEQEAAKLREQEALNAAVRCQLETAYAAKSGSLEEQLQAATSECSALRRQADAADAMVELLRSSLRSRQEQHEQCIEDLARVRSELALAKDSHHHMVDFDALERELLAHKQRASELEAKLAASPRDTKSEMKLRIELERIRETASKDRRIALLRIADLEEQVSELSSAKTVMVESAERRAKQAELERDTETEKVKRLQDAIKQLTSDRSKPEGAMKKENQGNGHNSSSSSKTSASAQQTSECLQQ